MTKIITFHAAHRGTGKTNLTANLAAIMATMGHRVGVIDTDMLAPGLHSVFGIDDRELDHCLNDFVWTHFSVDDLIQQVVLPIPLGGGSLVPLGSSLFIVPASVRTKDITRVLYEGFDPQRLMIGLRELIIRLHLDFLLIDTQPGFHNEALLLMAVADCVPMVLRPQKQDFLDTAILVDVARQLGVPQIAPIANLVPRNIDIANLLEQLKAVYHSPISLALPFSEEMAALGSRDLLCVCYPETPLTQQLTRLAEALIQEVSTLPAADDRLSPSWIQTKQEAITGLELPDLLELPAPEQAIVQLMLRNPHAYTLTELAYHSQHSEAYLAPLIQTLVERGIVNTLETKPTPRYRIHLGHRRPQMIPDFL